VGFVAGLDTGTGRGRRPKTMYVAKPIATVKNATSSQGLDAGLGGREESISIAARLSL
jgi:hypothetical protein